jgi:hypothetical protein
MDVVVVVPAFDEARTVGAVVEQARAHAPVLVVDDGSADGTADLARAAGATVVRHPRRRGKGAALATAVTAARAWGAVRIVTLDADGQHDPADIPALLAAARATPGAIVIGTRAGGDGAALLPRGRALAIRVAGFWVNWIAGTAVSDTQSGFRVYPAALFDAVRLRGGRFVFETAVLVEALRHRWQVREVPVRVVPCAGRPSRFHPVTDGVAISAYLTGGALGRWAVEAGAAVREVLDVFTRERRRARHARMLAKAAGQAGMPSWGPALAVAAAEEIQIRAACWWRAPRARRARRVALATLGMPALLALTALAAALGGGGLGPLERLVRALYDQRALPPVGAAVPEARVEERPAWVPAPR